MTLAAHSSTAPSSEASLDTAELHFMNLLPLVVLLVLRLEAERAQLLRQIRAASPASGPRRAR